MKVFLSYSSRDRDFARRLAGDLGRAGMDVWFDEHTLRVGEDLVTIETAIRGSECLVVVLSVAAAESGWVDYEIELASSLNVRVMPVLLEDIHGRQNARFSGLAYADYRRRQDYRRSTHRLIAEIEGCPDRGRFLTAKEAVAIAKAGRNPTGELFGISQQGVATLYGLANFRDWEFADATTGTSRFWITEFYDSRESFIQAYAVMDGVVHELPCLYLYGTDGGPIPDSVITYSCTLNHLPGISEEHAQKIVNEHSDKLTTIARRYSRFRPIPLYQDFVDSTVAVSAAVESIFGSAGPVGPDEDLFVLVRLECDKRYRELPTWSVAFFDPTLAESVIAVGVDAVTGVIRHPRMRTELLNANFLSTHIDENSGNFILSAANQLRAIDNHIWDIPVDGEPMPTELTASEAISMAEELLRSAAEPQQWQLGFLSNTGVVRTALSPVIPSPEVGLMKRSGRAGQWVIEAFGLNPSPVTNNGHQGYAYAFKQIVCTRTNGAIDTGASSTVVLTSPLARSPLPVPLLESYESARMFAAKVAAVDFTVMSVALIRRPPAAEWHFRFYGPEDVIASVTISGDGRRLITSAPPSQV
jgi:TIR domain